MNGRLHRMLRHELQIFSNKALPYFGVRVAGCKSMDAFENYSSLRRPNHQVPTPTPGCRKPEGAEFFS